MAGDGSVDGGGQHQQHQHQQPHLMNAGNNNFVYPQQAAPWGGNSGGRGPNRPPLPGTDMGFGGGGPIPGPQQQQAAQPGGQGPRMGVGGVTRGPDSGGPGLTPVPAGDAHALTRDG